MSRSRLYKTLADYLVIAVSPALIMTLVGSLVFFLVQIFYQGQYEDRLLFVLAAFVLAATLIGRISIEIGNERAAAYGIALAIVTGLFISRFVVDQGGPLGSLGLPVNLGLLGLIWWCTHKLVWDCTLIDEEQDSSGEGLLEVARPNRYFAADAPEGDGDDKDEGDERSGEEGSGPGIRPPLTWRERLSDPPRRPHAPGVWIVYFSLAALPIFGLGQLGARASDLAQRRYVFSLLLVYVASALGLLLTTSFLGLRRYLRQRRLQMPAPMAALWIALGTTLAAGILVAAMLLPRPNPEYSVRDLAPPLTSPPQQSSRYATGSDGAEKNRPDSPAVTKQQGPPSNHAAPNAEPRGEGPPKPSAEPGAKPDAKSASHSPSATQPQQKPGDHGQTPQATPSTTGTPAAEPAAKPADQPQEQPGDQGKAPQEAPSTAERQRSQESGAPKTRETPPSAKEKSPGGERSSTPPSPRAIAPQAMAPQLGAWFVTALQWAIYVAVALGVGWALFRHGRALWEELRRVWKELRGWWWRLFGGKPPSAPEIAGVESAGPQAKPFAAYPNPFLAGLAGRLSAEALVRYSFEALEAWARERGVPRGPVQTPHEFVQQLAESHPPLSRVTRVLADLYCRVAYAPGTLPNNAEPLRRFWDALGEANRLNESETKGQNAPRT